MQHTMIQSPRLTLAVAPTPATLAATPPTSNRDYGACPAPLHSARRPPLLQLNWSP